MEVGFIGLGAMGSAMASNLVKAGHKVRAWNRSGEGPEGLEIVGKPADALQTEVVFTMLQLNTLAAGKRDAVEKVRPLLDVLSKKVWDMGQGRPDHLHAVHGGHVCHRRHLPERSEWRRGGAVSTANQPSPRDVIRRFYAAEAAYMNAGDGDAGANFADMAATLDPDVVLHQSPDLPFMRVRGERIVEFRPFYWNVPAYDETIRSPQ